MKDKSQNTNQIIRKDAKGCFVESLNDAFEIGRAHFFFASYDVNKPEGQRFTNKVPIYLPIEELVELCRQLNCGDLQRRIEKERGKTERGFLYQSYGGTSAKRMSTQREDGKSLSRVFKITVGDKYAIRLIAESGPGVEDKNGLISPSFGSKPENRVIVSMTLETFAQLMLVSEMHYKAWLTGAYVYGAGNLGKIEKSTTSNDEEYGEYEVVEEDDD